MWKKVVLIGLVLILVSFAVALAGSSFIPNNPIISPNSLKATNVTVGPGSFSYVQLSDTNQSFFYILASMSSNTNFYVFNQSGFSAWQNDIRTSNATSGLAYAISLEKSGAFLIYKNTSSVFMIPGVGVEQSPLVLYTYNGSAPYPTGSYYFVVDNTNQSPSYSQQVKASFIYTPPISVSATQGAINELLYVGGASSIFFIAGIIVGLYGLIKKAPEKPLKDISASSGDTVKTAGSVDPKYVDQLYKGIDKKRKKAKKTSSDK